MSEIMKILLNKIKTDIYSKCNNLTFYNLQLKNINSDITFREMIDELFNIFDNQVLFLEQVQIYFNDDKIRNNSNLNNILNRIINQNKQIIVNMLIKYLSKIFNIINKHKNINLGKISKKKKIENNNKKKKLYTFRSNGNKINLQNVNSIEKNIKIGVNTVKTVVNFDDMRKYKNKSISPEVIKYVETKENFVENLRKYDIKKKLHRNRSCGTNLSYYDNNRKNTNFNNDNDDNLNNSIDTKIINKISLIINKSMNNKGDSNEKKLNDSSIISINNKYNVSEINLTSPTNK